jgi:hypothetical protein
MTSEQLPREVIPPPSLENRVVARLHAAGLLKTERRSRWAVQVAAAIVIFAAGAASGALWSPPQHDQSSEPRFVLLLRGATTASPQDEQTAVMAYRTWAGALREQGRSVAGERLGRDAALVPAGGAVQDPVQGYFIISAASLDDAIAVARSAPHVARGGHIEVRPIDTPQ